MPACLGKWPPDGKEREGAMQIVLGHMLQLTAPYGVQLANNILVGASKLTINYWSY